MVHFQVRWQNQSKEDAQQSHLIGKCLASCVLSYRRCQPSHRLIYRLSIGRVSVDISVDISTKYRGIYRSSVSPVLVDCRSSIHGCISQPLVNSQPRQYRQYVSVYRRQSIGNVHLLVVYWLSIGTACSTFLLTSSAVLFVPHHTSPTSGIANNTNVLMSQKDPNYLTDMSYLEMGKLSNLQTNKLSLNLKKTKLWSCAAKKLFYDSFVG